MSTEIEAQATISVCGRYRYALTRRWDPGLQCVSFCMLNPSTADSVYDDPTIRKCVGFAKRWGFGSIHVVNLFAFRATDPRDLRLTQDPVGPLNDKALRSADCSALVVAWGASVSRMPQAIAQIDKLRARARVGGYTCLGRTKSEEPRHPLMLSYSTPREPWPEVSR